MPVEFELGPLATEGGICYSLKVAEEQWSLPVAVGPALNREVGSWFDGSGEAQAPEPL